MDEKIKEIKKEIPSDVGIGFECIESFSLRILQCMEELKNVTDCINKMYLCEKKQRAQGYKRFYFKVYAYQKNRDRYIIFYSTEVCIFADSRKDREAELQNEISDGIWKSYEMNFGYIHAKEDTITFNLNDKTNANSKIIEEMKSAKALTDEESFVRKMWLNLPESPYTPEKNKKK